MVSTTMVVVRKAGWKGEKTWMDEFRNRLRPLPSRFHHHRRHLDSRNCTGWRGAIPASCSGTPMYTRSYRRVYIRIYRRIMAFPREIDTFSDGWIGWKWKRRTNGVYNQDSISMNARFEVALSLIERQIYLYIYFFYSSFDRCVASIEK